MKPIIARWQTSSGDGIEHLVLRHEGQDIVAEGVVLGDGGQPAAVWYRVLCDSDWRVRDLRIARVGADRAVELQGDGLGRWRDDTGAAMPAYDGAIDVDFAATPFTNTLPIRRLDLRPGQSAEIAAVYVNFPDLTVSREPQRYTRLGALHYRFESLDGDFTRDIEVDEHGLVVSYPGLFQRIL
ncbi:putative glycolipid-binding domain-containing protein [Chelatococcus reniformis]|uniref:Uncharacterized protein n=1 Tax=Chelatococcus reniformis TaxID=1494448 RepID=A0A916XGR1_9HYPH|nr:putative glycolipid-binding domain-containing protein [Chelatococcus reniformis]GGC72152.1 hypothetical protein GCM10010994_33220 [Chelatococcus reniformis]